MTRRAAKDRIARVRVRPIVDRTKDEIAAIIQPVASGRHARPALRATDISLNIHGPATRTGLNGGRVRTGRTVNIATTIAARVKRAAPVIAPTRPAPATGKVKESRLIRCRLMPAAINPTHRASARTVRSTIGPITAGRRTKHPAAAMRRTGQNAMRPLMGLENAAIVRPRSLRLMRPQLSQPEDTSAGIAIGMASSRRSS